jgi:TFIIF-interacting CTD phosphatase-like protein
MKIIGIILIIYKMTVSREYEEIVHKQDNQGKWFEETKRSSEIVASNERKIPFILNDHTEQIIVNPDGATIDTVKILDEFLG